MWCNAISILVLLGLTHTTEAVQLRVVPSNLNENVPYLSKTFTDQNVTTDAAAARAAVQDLTEKFVAGAPQAALRVRSNVASPPNASHPFVFFHLRKAGGTSVRTNLVRVAEEMHLRKFIPCYGGVPCDTFDPPQPDKIRNTWKPSDTREKYHAYADDYYPYHDYSELNVTDIVVYGGHFFWPSMLQSLYSSKVREPDTKPVDLQFDCLVLLRRPISRVESCWNFRMIQNNEGSAKPPAISSASVDAVKTGLPLAMSTYGEGCNNEALRVLSNSGRAESTVNMLTSDQQWSPSTTMVLQETLEHMQQCVVGVLERCEETEKVVHGFFPWLSSFDCSETHHQKGAVPHEAASPEVQKEIERQNEMEMSVYKVANAMLDAQLAQLESEPLSKAYARNLR